MLRVRDISKRFGNKEAVRGVSFEVAHGESFGLLGPNGAGKSTTIAMICGLMQPSAGQILVNGIDVCRHPERCKQLMGVVPQDIALYPTLTARENLQFWGAMYGLSGRTLSVRVDEALDIAGLTDRQRERVETYSGGMKRRINIAASLLHHPTLLIMDEPTVGIDPQSRSNILETVRRLNAEQGMTILYTSHYMEEVEFLCQRLAIMDHGQIIAHGSLDQVRRVAGSETAIRLRVQAPDEQLCAALVAVSGVNRVKLENGAVVAWVNEAAERLALLIAAVSAANHKVLGVEVQEPNLESVFLHLTGRALRD